MSLLDLFKGKGESGFGYSSTAEEVTAGLELGGQVVRVTGASSGIGNETARVFALRGAEVLATGRSEASVRAACAGFEGRIVPLECELSNPESVRRCAAAVREQRGKLAALVCNAGIMALPRLERAHGYELQFFTNHIGHFLLVTSLLDRLDASGRVVVVSSSAHRGAPRAGIEFDNLSGERGYAPWRAYGQSKLANLLFAKQLARRLSGSGRTCNALHPGVIKTKLGRSMPLAVRAGLSLLEPLGLKSIAQGAATQCFVATHPSLARVSGQYFSDCNLATPSDAAQDPELAARLWQESERIVAALPAAAP